MRMNAHVYVILSNEKLVPHSSTCCCVLSCIIISFFHNHKKIVMSHKKIVSGHVLQLRTVHKQIIAIKLSLTQLLQIQIVIMMLYDLYSLQWA